MSRNRISGKGQNTGKILFFNLLISVMFFLPVAIMSSPRVTSVTMTAPNPGFGQEFTVTVNYCANRYVPILLAAAVSTSPTRLNAQLSGSGQVFLVSSAGENVQAQNFASGDQIGFQVRGVVGAVPTDCNDCSGAAHKSGTYSVVLKMPEARDFPGCNSSNLYFHVMMRDSNIQENVWDDPADSCPPDTNTYVSPAWALPVPVQDFSIHKRAEGVLQGAGDLLLYSIDYEYGNGQLVIRDTIPVPSSGAFTLVSVGPQSMWTGGPAPGTIFPPGSGTLTWTLPNRTGVPGSAKGTVWFVLRMSSVITPGTVINNTASGTMPTAGTKTSTMGIVVGQSVVTLTKSQETGMVNYGENVTYYLNYTINGSKLVAYEPFDDLTPMTYTAGTGPPTRWKYRDPAEPSQQWSIYDECGTGDSVLRGSSANSKYPQMLLDSPMYFCQGIIVTDVLIDADYEGADALVVIRTNGVNTYGLLVTVDYNPGGGPISIQHGCSPGCSYDGGNPAHGVIMTNTWYRVKIQSDTGCDFKAKIWKKGEPEPAAWMINWTDGSCVTCTGDPTNWSPGVAQQGGATGYTHDSYNNFVIYNPRTSVSTTLYDTIPAGVSYLGNNGPTAPTSTTPRINWNLGSIANEGGSYTWWGSVTSCNPITNRGSMSGTGIVTVNSNEVITVPVCPTPVITLLKTANVGTASVGDSITFTLQACNSAAGPAANPMMIWDTIPNLINWGGWIGTAGTGTTAPGGLIQWNVAPLGTGSCVTRQWWGIINGAP